MLKRSLFILAGFVAIVGCNPQPPVVDVIPPPEPTEHFIDQYYYVQFTWGKNQDTITIQTDGDTLDLNDSTLLNLVFDVRNEPVYDSTGNSVDPLEPPFPKKDWHYAPSSNFTPYMLIKSIADGDLDGIDKYGRNIFQLSFPWTVRKDTFGFWDIQDYLNNPSITEGSQKWGRIGNNILGDTIWNQDAQDGAMISYTDTGGVVWESDNHPTFQPFGYFQLDKVQFNSHDGYSYNVVTGQFAVRLYDAFGNSRDMKNGKFRMRILSDIELSEEPK